jgi:hypothetical protein
MNMADKMKTLQAVAALDRGEVVYASQLEQMAEGNLDGMVANSELVRCHHSGYIWYIAWRQKPDESIANVADRMAAAISPH